MSAWGQKATSDWQFDMKEERHLRSDREDCGGHAACPRAGLLVLSPGYLPLALPYFHIEADAFVSYAGKTVCSSLPLTSTGLASIRMKAATAGTEPLLTQV
jgi:hypothetical protein